MIRELKLSDAERIAEIEQQEQLTPIPYKNLYQWFSGKHFGWGLEKDGWLYGYTIAERTGNQVYSSITCIVKAMQNQKEGRALCYHALQEVKKAGAELVTFEVRRSNIAELNMVKHFGAYQVGEKAAYYPDGEDALIMNIDLRAMP